LATPPAPMISTFFFNFSLSPSQPAYERLDI
jgi:hypothetical protein